MRNVSPIRQSPAATIEILLGTRLQAESGASHRKQRLGALSTRYTKSLPLASRDAVPERSSLASPDALSTKPAPSARHSASPGRKAWVNQKTRISTFCAASPAQDLHFSTFDYQLRALIFGSGTTLRHSAPRQCRPFRPARSGSQVWRIQAIICCQNPRREIGNNVNITTAIIA